MLKYVFDKLNMTKNYKQNQIINKMQIIDHSVSKETFTLKINPMNGVLQTLPQPENLSKYYESEDYISHTDSKRTLIEKLYHLVKQRALKQKVSLIQNYQPSTINHRLLPIAIGKQLLLDIGAGTGDFLVEAKKAGINTLGFEPNPKARTIAINKGITLVEQTQSIENKTVDVITMWHVLEHVPDLASQINELKRLLKPSGILIVAVPNYKSYDASFYKQYWAAYDVPRHLWHFSSDSMIQLFEKQNFKHLKTLPMWFDSFYVSMLSEKYKTGRICYIRAFLIGLLSNIKGMLSKQYSSHIYIFKK